MSKEPKSKRAPKPGKLAQELAAKAEQITRLETEIQNQAAVIAEKDRAEQRAADEVRQLRGQLKLALDTLRPFHDKTKDWVGQWPPDAVAVTRQLTFGDLRRASETFITLNK